MVLLLGLLCLVTLLKLVSISNAIRWLAAVSAVALVLSAHAPQNALVAPRNVYGGMGAALGILLMAGIILLTCESFISYVVFGSYGAAFHRSPSRETGTWRSPRCSPTPASS